MKRFEFGSSKFWEVETRNTELLIRFGKLGANGQVKVKALPTAAAAEAEMAKAIAEKTRKGYVEVGGKATRAPKAT
ncbi:MAG: WGR domain-containing protein, partial [Proteobacteria bacterium]|nr:WGR domain-containing protein [Pseudomonadota bacterium]